jgi:general stress protein YciG
LGPSLGALALKLIVVEDSEALRRVAGRLRKRDSRRVRNSVVHVTRTKREFQKMGRIGGPLSRTYMSKERASEIGRKAAQARWSKPRVAQVKGSAAKNISRAVAARDRQRKAV